MFAAYPHLCEMWCTRAGYDRIVGVRGIPTPRFAQDGAPSLFALPTVSAAGEHGQGFFVAFEFLVELYRWLGAAFGGHVVVEVGDFDEAADGVGLGAQDKVLV